jgi:plastocyanin
MRTACVFTVGDSRDCGAAVMRTLLGLLAVAFGAVAFAGPATAKTFTVSITKSAFTPDELAVATGDSVTWENRDSADHQVVSQQAGFASPVLAPGQTFTYTFARAGRFRVTDPLARKTLRMDVTVSVAAVTVALLPVTTSVVYGGRVLLSGAVSNGEAGEQVTIFARPCGATAAARLTTVTTTAGGAFSTLVQPLRNTDYTAQVTSGISPALAVAVKPRLVLSAVSRGRLVVTVRGSTSFSGRAVVLQRWNVTRRRWDNVRAALLVKRPGGTPPTVLSTASFQAAMRPGSRLRVSISRFQAGGCYRPAVSNAIWV